MSEFYSAMTGFQFDVGCSHEVLVHCGMSFNNESSVAGSSRSLNRNVSTPTSNHTEDPTFWVPPGTSAGHCSDVRSGKYFCLFSKHVEIITFSN